MHAIGLAVTFDVALVAAVVVVDSGRSGGKFGQPVRQQQIDPNMSYN